jgi:excinuclease ABC subunit C
MAYNNAKLNLENNKKLYENKVVKKQENIYKLGELLGIKPPKVIEAFDNSNLFGEYPVSAMVCYKNGIKSPSDYRKYHIKTVTGANDYETMKEVVYRRYYRLLMEDKEMPDLIIMDGGQIQVNACLEIINALNLNIPVLGLRKDNNHNTNVLWFENREIVLNKNDDLFLFLANIQQTVHDFAITFFRKSHLKSYKKTILDDIEGLGKARKALIFDTYENINDLYKADLNELCQLLPKEVAEKLFEKLHKSL